MIAIWVALFMLRTSQRKGSIVSKTSLLRPVRTPILWSLMVLTRYVPAFLQLMLYQQTLMFERLITHLQLKDATPSTPPNTPQAEGKYIVHQRTPCFLNRYLVS